MDSTTLDPLALASPPAACITPEPEPTPPSPPPPPVETYSMTPSVAPVGASSTMKILSKGSKKWIADPPLKPPDIYHPW